MKARTKKFTAIASFAVIAVMAASLGASSIFATADTDSSSTKAGRFYTDFTSQADCVAAGEEFNEELAAEGITLLKNDGTLPLTAGSKVSVLGVAQDCLIETSGSITESLKDAGFKVNPTLEEKYTSDSASYADFGSETALNNTETKSLSLYSDAAIVVIARGTNGESGDRSLDFEEGGADTYLGEDQGWEHEVALGDNQDDKHELQLTDSEQNLIKLAEENCKKVIVLYSASYTFEMANLKEDDNINAIAWIGRLGDGGISAVGKILNGEINPSGKTVDEWTRDFSNDPTYVNEFATAYNTNSTTTSEDGTTSTASVDSGYTELDYEEDIYLGYKFYETYWYEASKSNATPSIKGQTGTITADQWYDYNVVYPFGYGMSYSDFDIKLDSVTAGSYTLNGSSSTSIEASDLSSSLGNEANIKTMTAKVTVTNKDTSSYAGKETVEIYVNAPYDSSTATTEKSYLTLVGFSKTDTLKPGESETIEITFNVQDMASWDSTAEDGVGAYVLDSGDYNIYAMASSSHNDIDETNGSASFSLSKQAVLQLDDYSGNQVYNEFAEYTVSDTEEGLVYNDGTDSNDTVSNEYYSMLVYDDAKGESATTLSRADFDGTMPAGPSESDVLSADTISLLEKYNNFDADSYGDESDEPWYVESVPEGWDQTGTGAKDDGSFITLDEMAGVAFDDESWTTFMNQLTWEEICSLINDGYHHTLAIDSIGKLASLDDNGPNYTYNLTVWVGEPTVAATWNTELCEEYGRMVGNTALWQGMTGWYGPGMNIHRSQFAGRTPEYYSQDGLQGGYIAAAVVKGATDMGINVYVKHFALYDTMAAYDECCVSATEQNIRENYLKPFQMAMQEGGARAAMTSFNRIGAIYAGGNYNLITGIARNEWGWTGYTVTDIYAQIPYMTEDILIRAGADFPDGQFQDSEKEASGTWVASETEGEAGHVELDNGETSATQWYCARMAAQRILYNQANSAANFNGVTDTVINKTISGLTQGETNVSISILPDQYTAEDSGYDISATVTSGTLPAGLSIDNGMLTGSVLGLTSGDGVVVMRLAIDSWIGVTLNLSFDITPIVTMGNDISSLTAGEAISTTYVDFDSSNITYKSSYTMSISDGALPEGLSMDENGKITGTPTTEGTYEFTVAVNAVDESSYVLSAYGLENKAFLESMVGSSDYDIVKQVTTAMGMWEAFEAMGLYEYASETYYLPYTITVTAASGNVTPGDTTGDNNT
ncbi:MAG: glycoside hydrolase family 3 C-terminal domain-containing protein, partial [Clostridia bacterium]|nr:glycoside hydrolase family 3 C-terminal domain-containing protein [Clostridia bacterium]